MVIKLIYQTYLSNLLSCHQYEIFVRSRHWIGLVFALPHILTKMNRELCPDCNTKCKITLLAKYLIYLLVMKMNQMKNVKWYKIIDFSVLINTNIRLPYFFNGWYMLILTLVLLVTDIGDIGGTQTVWARRYSEKT